MLSVIIPTDGVERTAVATLAALVPGAAAGVVREVLLVDRTDTDVIERVADVAGCHFLRFKGTRAAALAAGARQARSPWLMFLHPGAVLDAGWIEETTQFIQMVAASGKDRAGIFRYARAPYTDPGLRDGLKFVARIIAWALGRTGPSDRARALRADRRLPAGCPPLRGAAAAPARPLIPHHAAQPDHGRVKSLAVYLIPSNNMFDEIKFP
ncbi:hypothetical protein ACVILK_006711 [Bradyrhizobium embrapense]